MDVQACVGGNLIHTDIRPLQTRCERRNLKPRNAMRYQRVLPIPDVITHGAQHASQTRIAQHPMLIITNAQLRFERLHLRRRYLPDLRYQDLVHSPERIVVQLLEIRFIYAVQSDGVLAVGAAGLVDKVRRVHARDARFQPCRPF